MKHARADYNRIQDPANKIPQDEPVFLLLAQDSIAPKAVRWWAGMAKFLGAKDNIVNMAVRQAHEMELWQLKHGKKLPDMPEGM